MGTRADFYVGRGESAEWLGSIAFDGYPSGITPQEKKWPNGHIFDAATKQEYRDRLAVFFANRRDVTLPVNGWPWPWEDSRTTDYAYAFDNGVVYGSHFGYGWFVARDGEPNVERDDDGERVDQTRVAFPKFSKDRMAMPGSDRSGIMVIGL